MKVSGVYCLNCKVYVYSRARHDMTSCNCKDKSKRVLIDGGQSDYVKISSGKETRYKFLKVDIGELEEDVLYSDWNNNENQYGKILNLNLNRAILLDIGGITIENLEHLSYYIGISRNSKVAIWDNDKKMFFHTRYKMKKHIIDSLRHPEMDDGYDLFIPIKKLDSPYDYLPKELNNLTANKIFPKKN